MTTGWQTNKRAVGASTPCALHVKTFAGAHLPLHFDCNCGTRQATCATAALVQPQHKASHVCNCSTRATAAQGKPRVQLQHSCNCSTRQATCATAALVQPQHEASHMCKCSTHAAAAQTNPLLSKGDPIRGLVQLSRLDLSLQRVDFQASCTTFMCSACLSRGINAAVKGQSRHCPRWPPPTPNIHPPSVPKNHAHCSAHQPLQAHLGCPPEYRPRCSLAGNGYHIFLAHHSIQRVLHPGKCIHSRLPCKCLPCCCLLYRLGSRSSRRCSFCTFYIFAGFGRTRCATSPPKSPAFQQSCR